VATEFEHRRGVVTDIDAGGNVAVCYLDRACEVVPRGLWHLGRMKLVVAVRSDVFMRRGKESAQVAHATAVVVRRGGSLVRGWARRGEAIVVVQVYSAGALHDLATQADRAGVAAHIVRDAGQDIETCIAIGPDIDELVDPITSGLDLR